MKIKGGSRKKSVPQHPICPCGICNKHVNETDKALCCDDCDFWIHASCAEIDQVKYESLQKCKEKWFCSNCAAPCGICTNLVRNRDSAIECDKCHLWLHTLCAAVPINKYQEIQSTKCTWLCPKCDNKNLSTDISNQPSLKLHNSFQSLLDEAPQNPDLRDNFKFTSSISMLSINIHGLRGKRLNHK